MNIIKQIKRDILEQLEIDHINVKKLKYTKIYLKKRKKYEKMKCAENKIWRVI